MEYKKDNLKILIVDDSEIDLNILESILMQIGFHSIIKTTSAKEGLRLVSKHKPDLIISDIVMPDLTGGEFREILKENADTENIPVIFVSSIISKIEEERYGGRLASGDLLIAKPYSRERISEIIEIALT
ncbi:MAG: response regulator [Thermodesulfobacteriota bacterium]